MAEPVGTHSCDRNPRRSEKPLRHGLARAHDSDESAGSGHEVRNSAAGAVLKHHRARPEILRERRNELVGVGTLLESAEFFDKQDLGREADGDPVG